MEKKIDNKIKKIAKSVEDYNNQFEPIRADRNKLKQIKWCIDVASGTVDPDAEDIS